MIAASGGDHSDRHSDCSEWCSNHRKCVVIAVSGAVITLSGIVIAVITVRSVQCSVRHRNKQGDLIYISQSDAMEKS